MVLSSGTAHCGEQEPVLYTANQTDGESVSLLEAWPAMARWQLADGSLQRNYGHLLFTAECAAAGHQEVRLADFVQRITTHTADSLQNRSVYIFEDRFSSIAGIEGVQHDSLLQDVAPPLPLLRLPRDGAGYQFVYAHSEGQEPEMRQLSGWRPKFKWFLVGGAGSGLGIHQDPHGSAAWNSTIVGSKRWCFFPPSTARALVLWGPGELDEGMRPELAAHEWFESVFPRLQQLQLRDGIGMIEGLQHAGEVVCIPPNWWHLVENLEPTVAFTENFVTTAGIGSGLLGLWLEGNTPQAVQWFCSLPCSWRCMAAWGALKQFCCHSQLADCALVCTKVYQDCVGCCVPVPMHD